MATDETKLRPARSRRTSIAAAVLVIVVIAAGVAIAWERHEVARKPKITLITSTNNVYWDRVIRGAQWAASQLDAELSVVRINGDAKLQLQSIDAALDSGVDGLIVSPIDPDVQAAGLANAARKVRLVTIDSDCPNSNRAAYVGSDNYFAGRQSGRLVRRAFWDGGTVIICVGSVITNGSEGRSGLIDELMGRPDDRTRSPDPLEGVVKGDKYTVLATLVDGVDRAKATAIAAEAIKQHPDVKCFVGLMGYSGPAILEALKDAGKLGKIKVVCFDDAEPTLAGIESGDVAGSVVQDQFNMGADSMLHLCGALRHASLPQRSDGAVRLICRMISDSDGVQMIRCEQQHEQSQTPASGTPNTNQ